MKTFFDEEMRLERLTELGDVLIKLKDSVKWEMFRSLLDEIYYVEDNRAGGRKAFDRVMMFKLLVLQELYNISDDGIEYQINDRLSFQRFLGLELGDKVPDAKTIWLFREKLKKSGREKELFNLYTATLKAKNIVTKSGSIIDATFIERPEQKANARRNPNNRYKKPENKEENPHKDRQYDGDARYTKKNGKWYYGYKNHVKADRATKIILDYAVTDATTHDTTPVEELLNQEDNIVWMDAGYRSSKKLKAWQEKYPEADIRIAKAALSGKPLTEEEKLLDKPNSRIRCRIEHIFGHMQKSMGGKFVRCVGLARTNVAMMLKNLAYNIRRELVLPKPLSETKGGVYASG